MAPFLRGVGQPQGAVTWQLKIGINGFGRIGRLVFRAALENPNVEFVGVNDIVPPDNLAYLLKYDSTHGRFAGTVEAKEDGFVVNGKHVPCYSIRNPAELPWGKNGADYVIESTGLFTDYAGAERASQSRREASDFVGADQRPGKDSDAADRREPHASLTRPRTRSFPMQAARRIASRRSQKSSTTTSAWPKG